MNWTRVQEWWFGSLHMELRGIGVPDVIVELQRKGVELRHVRLGQESATLLAGVRDFGAVYQVCRRHRVKIRFLERAGMPFTVRRIKRRKTFVAGMLLFVFLVYTQSQVIWRVTIDGVPEDTALAVRQAAAESGLYVGAWRGRLADMDRIQADIQKRLPNLTWVGVNVQGTIAHIEAVEKIPGVLEERDEPHNVVAAKPATIRRVFASRGKAVVKPGQVVQAGQLLISGLLADGKEVPAEGQVWAEVWYTSQVSLPMQVTQSGLTGKSVQREYLRLGPLAVRVWGWQEPRYQASVERTDETQWHIGKWLLPVQLQTVTVYEAHPQAVESSVAEAEKRALTLAKADVRRQMGGDGVVLEQKVLQRKVSHGKLYEKVFTRVEEDIATEAPIPPAPEKHKVAPNTGSA
ncbi:MAG: sporulation protein YqfD [Alicyclobacillus herbarius]|uniref:sporulation protein YqfD n=1 Tax=Alicyclobacillus herbarius TaxID=122960 RepID=UPI0023562290|nr:sporulation protein YqfD [Alicyclobacillus herbarius]MCL6631086.1 sporulation protein YqfD [Alicyclobacillus herbarius]